MTVQPGGEDQLIGNFNKAHQNSDVDFGPDATHHTLGLGPQQAAPGNHSGHIPVGGAILWGPTYIPPGFLQCLGQAISRLNYAALFKAIGTLYGVGDGSTTFNIPNIGAGSWPGGMSYIIKY